MGLLLSPFPGDSELQFSILRLRKSTEWLERSLGLPPKVGQSPGPLKMVMWESNAPKRSLFLRQHALRLQDQKDGRGITAAGRGDSRASDWRLTPGRRGDFALLSAVIHNPAQSQTPQAVGSLGRSSLVQSCRARRGPGGRMQSQEDAGAEVSRLCAPSVPAAHGQGAPGPVR